MMKIFLLAFVLLFSGLSHANEVINLTKDKWEVLQYSGIKPNKVSFNNQTMKIDVNQSAGPLVYPFSKPKRVKEIVIEADVIGSLKLKNSLQGSKGNDDFTLRIGLVYQGKKRLGFMKKQIAASWIKRLYSLAPKNLGVSHVEFFTVYQDKRLENQRIKHSKSDLLVENFVIAQPKDGKIKTSIKVPENIDSLAIWISSDGDDTQSTFAVKINKLTIK